MADSDFGFLSALPAEWRPRGVCLDVDGVLIRRPALVPGAAEFIAALHDHSMSFKLVTNNSRQTPGRAAAQFREQGLDVCAGDVLTAADALAQYVTAGRFGARPRVYPAATADLAHTLREHGCRVVKTNPEVVCLGHDPLLTFDKLARTCDRVRECGCFVVGNLDATIPSESGSVPGLGAIAAAIQIATGITPINVGKPAPTMFQLAAVSMGLTPGDVLAIGDRIDSDIEGAQAAGCRSALVLTGAHGMDDIDEFAAKPDIWATDLFAVANWLWSEGRP